MKVITARDAHWATRWVEIEAEHGDVVMRVYKNETDCEYVLRMDETSALDLAVDVDEALTQVIAAR
jgi:hypothetical protein